MNAIAPRSRMNWSARLMIGLSLIIVGATAAVWIYWMIVGAMSWC